MSRKLVIPSLLMCLFLASACSAGQSLFGSPPAGETVSACSSKCKRAKIACDNREDSIYAHCMELYGLQQQNFEMCESARGNLPYGCNAPNLCPPPDKEMCARHNQSCRLHCRGEIIGEYE